MSYECNICHTIQASQEGLCTPIPAQNECLKPTNLAQNLERGCLPVRTQVMFYCEGCERPTPEPEQVCHPMAIRSWAFGQATHPRKPHRG